MARGALEEGRDLLWLTKTGVGDEDEAQSKGQVSLHAAAQCRADNLQTTASTTATYGRASSQPIRI